MEALLSYYERNSIYIDSYRDKVEALKKIQRIIPKSEETKIYISNIYEKNEEEKIYIFDESRMIEVGFFIKDSSLTTRYRVMKLSELKSFDLTVDTGYRAETKLTLEFSNRKFELDNIENFDDSVDEDAQEKKRSINGKILEGIFEYLLNI